MKYIRTTNGIYDLDKSILYAFTRYKIKMPYCEEYEKQPELCKTADTIEELCDYAVAVLDKVEKPILEFVGYGNYTSKERDFKDFFKDCEEEIKNGTGKVYGAIWTNKGLIYVAKMNEKGEFKLL